jgi:hypothetical protein
MQGNVPLKLNIAPIFQFICIGLVKLERGDFAEDILWGERDLNPQDLAVGGF